MDVSSSEAPRSPAEEVLDKEASLEREELPSAAADEEEGALPLEEDVPRRSGSFQTEQRESRPPIVPQRCAREEEKEGRGRKGAAIGGAQRGERE